MARLLESKAFVVIGAGRGVGRAVALELARRGARLVLADRGCDPEGAGEDPTVIEAVAREARALGAVVETDASDVTVEGVPDALVQRAAAAFDGLDGVVLCAGIKRARSLRKTEDVDVERALGVHWLAPFRLARAATRYFADAGRPGSIVLTAGASAFFGAARQSALAAAELATIGLVRAAAVEIRRHHVRINAVVPNARTRLTEDLPLYKNVAATSLTPEHVAPLYAFLLSDLAGDVNGEVLGIAGNRIYALQLRETTGAFLEPSPVQPEAIAAGWLDITRGG